MRSLQRIRHRVAEVLGRIHLVDKCLIIFMIVLLLQSAYGLFFGGRVEATQSIDVIIRTASASIFGYFLSANFIQHTGTTRIKNQDTSLDSNVELSSLKKEEGIYNRVGFEAKEEQTEIQYGKVSISPLLEQEQEKEIATASRMQIIVAATIGLFCLISLLLLRNGVQWNFHPHDSGTVAATVAQFRDFISGCVGFLIGCPTRR